VGDNQATVSTAPWRYAVLRSGRERKFAVDIDPCPGRGDAAGSRGKVERTVRYDV